MANGSPGAPFGNQNAKGKGRKSAWSERADANIAYDIFFKRHNLKKLKRRILTGIATPRDLLIAKIYQGNDKMLKAVWDKVAANKIDMKPPIPVSSILDEEISEPD